METVGSNAGVVELGKIVCGCGEDVFFGFVEEDCSILVSHLGTLLADYGMKGWDLSLYNTASHAEVIGHMILRTFRVTMGGENGWTNCVSTWSGAATVLGQLKIQE